MKISVCVGSACHLKGSYEVITRLQQLIEDKNLQNEIELIASFCLGNCANGVSVTVNDKLIQNCTIETVDSIFEKEIMSLL